MNKSALFSEDGAHRLMLERSWDESLPKLQMIGLNPSRADAHTDDPTIRRIISLTKFNGYGGFIMTNLFTFITPYPGNLVTGGGENDMILKLVHDECGDVCFCWGAFKVEWRANHVIRIFPGALCFGKNKNGSPKHPLYLKSDTKLIKF